MLEVRTGGGCLSIFGLPFLATGLLVLAIAFGLLPVPVEQGAGLLALLVGGMFTVVGGGLVFGRSSTRVDRRAGEIVTRWTAVVTVREVRTPLVGFQRVTLDHKSGDSDSADTYPVGLAGDGVKALTLASPAAEPAARQAAAELARFLRLPLLDRSLGVALVRDPERIDESLLERMRRTRERVDIVTEPPALRTAVVQTETGVELRIPPPTLAAQIVVAALPALLMLGFLALAFGRPALALARAAGAPALALALLVVLLWSARTVRRLRRDTVVRAAPDGLAHERRFVARAPVVQRIAASELREIVLARRDVALGPEHPARDSFERWSVGQPDAAGRPAPRWVLWALSRTRGITVRATGGSLTFGTGLPEPELLYLRARIVEALAGDRGGGAGAG
ncbi:MAG: hypothetical protein KBD01_02385 [Acidobacteria bacterium]|nr:hypothetical protein [Acidobacteriota bacterium]